MLHVHQLARYAVRQLCDISFSLRSISYLIREICWLKINQFPCQVIKKLMKGLTIDDTDNWGDLVCHKRAVVLITHNFHFLLSKEYSIWMRLLHSSEQKKYNLERRFRYMPKGKSANSSAGINWCTIFLLTVDYMVVASKHPPFEKRVAHTSSYVMLSKLIRSPKIELSKKLDSVLTIF